jgi:hypothetical protein
MSDTTLIEPSEKSGMVVEASEYINFIKGLFSDSIIYNSVKYV